MTIKNATAIFDPGVYYLVGALSTGPYGDPLAAMGLTDPAGLQRRMLFFQDRSAK